MAYKPVGVDQNSRFPPRVEAALGLLFPRRIRRGSAKPSGGVLTWGIPSVSFVGSTTGALNPNEIRYLPFEARSPLSLNALQFEVTSAPATAANVAIGIYAADTNMQPTGSPVYDSGSISVATGFTGVKSVTNLTVILPVGSYLLAINTDKAMTLRELIAPSPTVIANLGANPIASRHTVAQVFGAYPTSPTQWTVSGAGSVGYIYDLVLQWTETT